MVNKGSGGPHRLYGDGVPEVKGRPSPSLAAAAPEPAGEKERRPREGPSGPYPTPEAVLAEHRSLLQRVEYLLASAAAGKQLGQALIRRYLEYTYLIPASEKHHHAEWGGLFAHSLDVALKALAEFEVGYLGERRADGTLDNFASNRRRPLWQYAVFVGGLLHDFGKVFNVAVRDGPAPWNPLDEPLTAFMARHPRATLRWRADAAVSEHHSGYSTYLAGSGRLIQPADIAYMGMARWGLVMKAITADRVMPENPISRFIKGADRDSAREGLAVLRERSDDQVAHFVRALRALIRSGHLKVNCEGAPVFVQGDQTAVVVPQALERVREFLAAEKITLMPNNRFYDLLRDRGLAQASASGLTVKRIRVQIGRWKPDRPLAAVIVSTSHLFSDTDRRDWPGGVTFEDIGAAAAPGEPADRTERTPSRRLEPAVEEEEESHF